MTRIGENSDDQRIREMQEADRRQKADSDKRLDQERTTKSFQEVMTQRGARENARRITSKSQSEADAAADNLKRGDARTTLEKHKPKVLGDPRTRELQKKAALAAAHQGQLNKTRSALSESATAMERDRNLDLVRRTDDELDNIRGDVDKDVDREQRVDEQHALDHAAPILVDGDEDGRAGQRRDQQRKGEGEDERPAAAGVAAARTEGAQGATPTKIPTEILEHIAKSVAIAAATDGRVSMAISLKGTMLDGVTVHVTANKGKVRCVFEGCDKQLGNLIESSKGELMRQLGKRGLDLDILRVK